MSDSKHLRWVDAFDTDGKPATNAPETALPPDQPAANDADGWQQYRRWISKAPAPKGRRSSIDPSLYTWKGYRNWTEQVRRNWPDDSGDVE